MRVLVTGGAGYIGSHAAKALALAGHAPVVYDNLSRGHAWAVRWGPLVQGDLAGRDLLAATLRTHRIEAVMHFAALAYVAESMAEPGLYFRNNVGGSIALLEAMRAADVRTLVFSSTCATYGAARSIPISEDHPQAPESPYGESKLAVEKMLRWYGQVHGFRSVSLRYFNAAGADAEAEIGESHEPETHLIPLALEAAEDGGAPLRIWGTDYATPDGTAVRDYVHVSDLAEAHVQALGYLEAGGGSLALNLGAGRGSSVREVVEAVRAVTGRAPRVQECPRRAGDPEALIADARRAALVLGWQPRESRLERIIETAWNWKRKQRPASVAGQ